MTFHDERNNKQKSLRRITTRKVVYSVGSGWMKAATRESKHGSIVYKDESITNLVNIVVSVELKALPVILFWTNNPALSLFPLATLIKYDSLD